MKKKLLSVFMAAALSISLFSAVPIVSHADRPEYTSGDFTYSIFDWGCGITGYKGSDSDVVIPSELDGYPVSGIGDDAFSGNTNITKVTFPEGIQSIGNDAFKGCVSLKEIKLPNSVEIICGESFKDCSNLSNVDLGNGVTTLAYSCFSNCDSLTSINIPASMTTTDSEAGHPFSGCDALKTATFESGGVTIPMTFFEGCSALQKIIIPEGIQTIELRAFADCTSLEDITIPNSVQTIECESFKNCSSLKKIAVAWKVKEISTEAFWGCSSLTDFYDFGMETGYEGQPFDKSTTLTIHGPEGSNAQKYANSNNINFVPIPLFDNTELPMYRLYNENSGEHFFTSDYEEQHNLVSLGWADEGTAWTAPAFSTTPVYRVYNPNSGEHHYTVNVSERDNLVSLGWNDEGIGWYSDDDQVTPLYRLYNPNATGQYEAGGHHYTKDVNEKNTLIEAGWRDEDIGWYGI